MVRQRYCPAIARLHDSKVRRGHTLSAPSSSHVSRPAMALPSGGDAPSKAATSRTDAAAVFVLALAQGVSGTFVYGFLSDMVPTFSDLGDLDDAETNGAVLALVSCFGLGQVRRPLPSRALCGAPPGLQAAPFRQLPACPQRHSPKGGNQTRCARCDPGGGGDSAGPTPPPLYKLRP